MSGLRGGGWSALACGCAATMLVAVAGASAATLAVRNKNDSGPESLREAISTSSPGDTIAFDIPGAGFRKIALLSPLPVIDHALTIDGTTQYDYVGGQLIELDGELAGAGASGLVLHGHDGSTIRGLIIDRFHSDGSVGGNGIEIDAGSNRHTIQGNLIGLDASGTYPRGNHNAGIVCNGSNNRIGGATAADRNVITANWVYGIVSTAGEDNVVQGNYIGRNATGGSVSPNPGGTHQLVGITVAGTATNMTIGGSGAGEGNVVASNEGSQIFLVHASSTGHVVQGNRICTVNGTSSNNSPRVVGITAHQVSHVTIGGADPGAGNVLRCTTGIDVGNSPTNDIVIQGNDILASSSGIVVRYERSGAPSNVLIGGIGEGEGNTIANYISDSIQVVSGIASDLGTVASPMSVTIRANSLSGGSFGSGLGIDLENESTGSEITPNDAGDADGGANGLQNFPVLASAEIGPSSIDIHGTLETAPGAGYEIDFFASSTTGPSGYGRGTTYLGSTSVATDGGGSATIAATLPVSVAPGSFVTATATDESGNTSEISAAVTALSPTTTTTTTTVTVTTVTVTTTTAMTGSTATPASTTTTSSVAGITTTTLACDAPDVPGILCLLGTLPPPSCTGARLPNAVESAIAARRFVVQLPLAAGRSARRLRKQAVLRMNGAISAVVSAGKRQKLKGACPTDLLTVLTDARDRIWGLPLD